MVLTTLLDFDQLFLLILLIVLSIVYLTRQHAAQFPNGPWGFPLIGNYRILQTRPHIRLSQLVEKFGDVFSIKVGRQKVVIVSSWEGISEGLVKKSLKMSGRPRNLIKNMFHGGMWQGGNIKLFGIISESLTFSV